MNWKLKAPNGSRHCEYLSVQARLAAIVAATLFFVSDQAGGQDRVNSGIRKIAATSIAGGRFTDCFDICPAIRKLTAGKALMGATDAQEGRFALRPLERLDIAGSREVRIRHDFAIGVFDVMRKEFASFVRESRYRVPSKCIGYKGNVWASGMNWLYPGFRQTDSDPVVCVSPQDASAYIQWLSKKTGKRYRLPTEAEWEYAARAGSNGSNYWDDHPESACMYANVADERYFKNRHAAQGRLGFPCNDRYASTSPAGSFKPNNFGLFDMLGGVSQITQDCFARYFSPATERNSSIVIADCLERPLRGGSYQGPPKYEVFWMRAWIKVDSQENAVGFRIARDLP